RFVQSKRRVETSRALIDSTRGRLTELAKTVVHDAQMTEESGHQMIAFYRACNRRGRREVPQYFDDDTHRNHRASFAELSIDPFARIAEVSSADPLPHGVAICQAAKPGPKLVARRKS